MNPTQKFLLKTSFLFLFFCAACGNSNSSDSGKGNVDLLSFELTSVGNEDFDATFRKARELGLLFVTLSVPWDDIERSPGEYTAGVLADANGFYSE
jgi:hypothetical protein